MYKQDLFDEYITSLSNQDLISEIKQFPRLILLSDKIISRFKYYEFQDLIELVPELIKYLDHINRNRVSDYSTYRILISDSSLIEYCDLSKLDSNYWYNLLLIHPGLSKYCEKDIFLEYELNKLTERHPNITFKKGN